MKKRRKNNNRISGMIGQSDGVYSTVEYPEPDGKSTRHRPSRNNPWGNLIEEDTYQENYSYQLGYDYSDSDYENDHDYYYSNSHYD